MTVGRTAPLWVLAVAVVLLALYGHGYVGYDGFYSLVWGSDLAGGRTPDFDVAIAPTPHPLSIVAGAVLSPLGQAAPHVFQACVLLSFAVLGWAAFALGDRLFQRSVGVLFVCILLTRPALVREVLHASIDVPFLALVVTAAAVEVARPRRGSTVLVLLAAAGLLRPEAWLLSVAYLAYRFPVATRTERIRLSGLAIIAPIAWAAIDLAITGDPLHSLHGTRELAEQLDRPRSAGTAPQVIPGHLLYILGDAVAWGGAAGCVAAIWLFYERALLPTAVLFIGLLAFLFLGVAGLPLLVRYLLLPAIMLALFCAAALVGWRQLRSGTRAKRLWAGGALVLACALVLSAPGNVDELREARELAVFRSDVQRDLLTIADHIDTRHCRPVQVPNHRPVPLLAHRLDASPSSIVIRGGEHATRGTLVIPASQAVERDFLAIAGEARGIDLSAPRGFRRSAANASWALYERCRGA